MNSLSFVQHSSGLVQSVDVRYVQLGVVSVPMLDEKFLAGKVFLGSRQIIWFKTNSDQYAQLPSTAFFCCLCGEVWGRRILQPENWVVEPRFCLKHGDGSLLHHREISGFEDYPKDLVLYELMIATKDFI